VARLYAIWSLQTGVEYFKLHFNYLFFGGPGSEGFNRTIASESESNLSDLELKLATEQFLAPEERLWIG
jgi:hypothetical protein